MFGRLRAYKETREEVERLKGELAEVRERSRRQRERLDGLGQEPFDASRIVWIFGTGRSGSTWLASMMEDLTGHAVWHEPLVGELFGHLYYVRAGDRARQSKHFILGRDRRTWLGSIRSFVLNGAAARFPEVARGGYLVVKEPNGSLGAPLLAQALPESRLIFLVRDPRDVVASVLDGQRKGGWTSRRRGWEEGPGTRADTDPDAVVKQRARLYLRDVGNSKEAYESHEGPKALIRYEELRADTPGVMLRALSELGVQVDREELTRVAEKHSWDNIAEGDKGEGKFYRKAAPGSWKEDLTPEQAETVERVTGPLLGELYPR